MKSKCLLILMVWVSFANAIEFKWDAFNRLVETNGIKYLYDSQDRRVAKMDAATGEVLRVYIYHGWKLLCIYDGNNRLLCEFVDGHRYIDEHLTMTSYINDPFGETYYYVQNSNNYNVEAILDDDGDIVETYEYTAYGETTVKDADGNEIEWSQIGNPYGFHGRFYDPESHLYYFRYRMYMPEMKRFLSMDPVGYIDSMNLYETFKCDPINNVDPLGLSVEMLKLYAKEFMEYFGMFGFKGFFSQNPNTVNAYQGSIERLMKEAFVTYQQHAEELQALALLNQKAAELIHFEKLIAQQNVILNPTEKNIVAYEELTGFAVHTVADNTAKTLINTACKMAFQEGMKYGNPGLYKKLLAGTEISGYFSGKAARMISRVQKLNRLVRIVNLGGAIWQIYSAHQTGSITKMKAAELAAGATGLHMSAEVAVVQLAKRGVISTGARKLWLKGILSPIGWGILAGQIGQMRIEYLTEKEKIELNRLFQQNILVMYTNQRNRLIKEMEEIRENRFGHSGMMPLVSGEKNND